MLSNEIKDFKNLKVALIHYWLVTWRGGEKVIKAILELFPNADIYTLFLDNRLKENYLPHYKIYTSILNKISFFRKHHQKIFPLYPFGIASLKLRDNYDLIISSESGPAKGIKKPKKTPHICYVHTPMRYCWGFTDEYLKALPLPVRPIANFFFILLKEWDKKTIDNVDLYVANSINVKERIKRFYDRDSIVVYPPIDKDIFKDIDLKPKGMKCDYYLSFGALVPYKKIDLLVKVFNMRKDKLLIIGDGSEKKRLESMANPNIEFKGYVPDNELKKYIVNAKALLFPGEEDFGMIPLEVMARGVPVIAYGKGGALETVLENDNPETSTGLFFYRQSEDAIEDAIKEFEKNESYYDPFFLRNHALKFSEDNFKLNFLQAVKQMLKI